MGTALDALIFGYRKVMSALVLVASRDTLNFSSAFSVTDDAVNKVTTIDLVGGGGGVGFANACTLEQFGAVGDGVTNDQAAWAAAIAALNAGTYKTLVIGPKTYLVGANSTINTLTATGAAIIGHGWSSRLKTTATSSTLLQLKAANLTLRDFSAIGSQLANQHAFENGLDGIGSTTYYPTVTFTNVHVKDFDRGFSTVGPDTQGGQHRPIFVQCSANNCTYGFRFSTQAEYATLVGCESAYCSYGLWADSGNLAVSGCQFNLGSYGIYIAANTNDGHCTITACSVNHNSTGPVYVENIANSILFRACQMYFGTLNTSAAVTSAVTLSDCQIDVDALNVSGITTFVDCQWPGALANALTGSPVWYGNNRTLTGAAVSGLFGARVLQSPYSGSVVLGMANANYTVTAAELASEVHKITGGPFTAARTATYPQPSSDAYGYKRLICNLQGGAFAVSVATGTGTPVSIAQGKRAWIGFDSGGPYRITADT